MGQKEAAMAKLLVNRTDVDRDDASESLRVSIVAPTLKQFCLGLAQTD